MLTDNRQVVNDDVEEDAELCDIIHFTARLAKRSFIGEWLGVQISNH